jgi:hypothetical protein
MTVFETMAWIRFKADALKQFFMRIFPVNYSLPTGLAFFRAKLQRPGGTARATSFEVGGLRP